MTLFERYESTSTTPFTALAPAVIRICVGSSSSLSYGTVWDTVVEGRSYCSQTVLSTGTVFAEPVTILWQSSDLSRFPSAFATAPAATIGVKLDVEPSLGTGAKAGIVIGAVLGLGLLAGAVIVLCLRRRNRAQHPDLPENMAEVSGHSSGLKKMFVVNAELESTEDRSAWMSIRRKCMNYRCRLPCWKRRSIKETRTLCYSMMSDRNFSQRATEKRYT